MERTVWNTRPKRRSKSQKLAQEALQIEAEEARAAGALGFMARILVQATLPHSRPSTHEFERINGRFTLYMNFKRKFLRYLSDVLHIYPAARLFEKPAGIVLRKSPTHPPRRG